MPGPDRTPTGQAPATVTVAGAGGATAVPDTALLQLGVEARGSAPAEALDACGRALDQVIAALDAEGVEPAARTTSSLELHEDWDAAVRSNLQTFEGKFSLQQRQLQEELSKFIRDENNRLLDDIHKGPHDSIKQDVSRLATVALLQSYH